jgi:hypothetical protein
MRTLIAFVMLAMMTCAGASLGTDAASGAQAGKVKGSKSNTSDRTGNAGARGVTVNNSKSNNY